MKQFILCIRIRRFCESLSGKLLNGLAFNLRHTINAKEIPKHIYTEQVSRFPCQFVKGH